MTSRFGLTAGLSLAFAFALLAPLGSNAQEKQPFAPEVIAILGEPEADAAGLDADVINVLGPPQGTVPTSETALNTRATSIGSKLRCPVCQGVAISDSPAGLAVKMRGQVRDLVAKGYSDEQIMSYFERSYGEFVRLEPPMQGLNLMLWFLPVAALLGGAFLVLRKARQPVKTPSVAGTVSPEGPSADPALAKYLERIRRDSGTLS